METLIRLLTVLIEKTSFLTEAEKQDAEDLLRQFAGEQNVQGVVPPAATDANQMPPTPAVDPGPVAEPVPADQQPPPPTGTEAAASTEPASPEATNAFSGTDPNAPAA